ncbi:hypothetical protein YTPLAS18_17210 [Nitrospira sp.]|nr:hypothetical protein YTPLAS18_17210 [Nitrospira sp.]
MPCPRCLTGLTVPDTLHEGADAIRVSRCVVCGHVFGEQVIDYHHSLDRAPEPRPEVVTPVWDPTHRRGRLRI